MITDGRTLEGLMDLKILQDGCIGPSKGSERGCRIDSHSM